MTKAKSSAKQKKASPQKSGSFKLKLFLTLIIAAIAWVIYLDAQVRFKFEGKRWSLPAQVFARPLELYEGQALNLDNLENELALLDYRQASQTDKPGTYLRSGSRLSVYRRAHNTAEGSQPAQKLDLVIRGDVVQNLSTDGVTEKGIQTLEPFKIGGVYPSSKQERQLIAYEDVPPGLISGLLATEDKDFFEHFGVSPLAIARAAFANISAGRVVQGGSTLTQQLVKNFYLTRERSLWRKANEALMSILLEAHYEKTDILETYINDVYLGQSGSTAIHGFAMASYFYFAKQLESCTLEELALLVGIVKGPSYYDPRRHPERAKQRRDLVLTLMHEDNWISRADMLEAQQMPLLLASKPRFHSNRYPAFMELVRQQLVAEYDADDLRSEGLKIYTTLDPQLQEGLESAIQLELRQLDARQPASSSELQTGAIVTAVGTGEVLAMSGDRRPRYSGFNRVLKAERAVGSLIKPAIYLTALEQPDSYQLPTMLSDDPFKLEFENGEIWQPNNFDDESHGNVPLYQALANSYNIASARLGIELGLDEVKATLRKLGVSQALNPYPSLLLGAQAMTPFEVAKFYQTIASNGFNMPLRAIREVADHDGNVLSRYRFEVEQVIQPEASYLLQSAMQETMRNGTGKSAYARLPSALHTAGKTGTTNDFRDSWFAGFSGDYLGVVWVGKDDNSSTGLTGSSGALKVWSRFMSGVPQYPLATPRPADVFVKWFDRETGKQTDESCSGADPLPVWGQQYEFEYQSCSSGLSKLKGWLKSWLNF